MDEVVVGGEGVGDGFQAELDLLEDGVLVFVEVVEGEGFAGGCLGAVLLEMEDGEGGEVVGEGGGDGACGGGGAGERGERQVDAAVGGVHWVIAGGGGDGCVEGVAEEEVVEGGRDFQKIDVDVADDRDRGGGVLREDVVEESLELGDEVLQGVGAAVDADEGVFGIGVFFVVAELEGENLRAVDWEFGGVKDGNVEGVLGVDGDVWCVVDVVVGDRVAGSGVIDGMVVVGEDYDIRASGLEEGEVLEEAVVVFVERVDVYVVDG